MSAKSIKAFEQANPHRAPTLQRRIKDEAARLRMKAQSLLAQANRLDDMANELEGKR